MGIPASTPNMFWAGANVVRRKRVTWLIGQSAVVSIYQKGRRFLLNRRATQQIVSRWWNVDLSLLGRDGPSSRNSRHLERPVGY